MKCFIRVHPMTLPFFVLIGLTEYKSRFFILYIFIFFHELSHTVTSILLGEKICSIKLLPFGCVLSLETFPCRRKSIFIYLAGPLFNLVMYFFGIFPTENLSLALFNLIPIIPFDGGVLMNLLFPKAYFYVSLVIILLMFFACCHLGILPIFPFVLLFLLYIGEKNRLEKTINSKLIGLFMSKK
ncbi:MAG: hypothetical protein IJ297_02330 [Clostridia bacterium]|nr:hypothetical protein [Clostridia bacterium]